MMRSAVTVSLLPQASGGPFVFWNGLEDACVRAAALGYDAVELFPPDAAGLDPARVRMLLQTHGLAVAAVGSGGGWVVHRLTLTHADAAVRARAREFIRSIIEVAASLGAPAIIGSMQGRWEGEASREQALAWLGEALEELGATAQERGMPLLYEPLNRYETNLFNRLGDTAQWLRQLRGGNVRILADLFHMNIEEADPAASLIEAGALIGHVHFVDSNRRAVGFGHTEIPPIVAALREIGYAGYLSAEVLPLPDPQTAARQTIESIRKALNPA
ncbi:MAG TPA: sugar phosphate isomerase/epimerase family protein [Chthoniobacteraceae bacterium]|jgi:sugar phosphate isomerase/epimerase|nr:sugar phosphate isomerase/epimerase family protein [Chthoniobacteraceae bacterium]